MLAKFTTVRGPVVAMTVLLSEDVIVRLPSPDTLKFQPLPEVTSDQVMLSVAEDSGRTANTAVITTAAVKLFEMIHSNLDARTFPPLLKIGRTFQT